MSESGFDPSQYLSKIKGQDYLEVKWRLVWFRREYPNGAIRTTPLKIEPDHAVIQAEVSKIGEGGEVLGVATGIGSETPQGFSEFIEKAETKAIGRALAALGYGTQFADDFAEAESVAIADAPVQRGRNNVVPMQGHNGSQRTTNGSLDGGKGVQNPDAAPSDKQVSLAIRLAQERGLSGEALDQCSIGISGSVFDALNRGGISAVIDALYQMPKTQGSQSATSNRDASGKRGSMPVAQGEADAAIGQWTRNIMTARNAHALDAVGRGLQEAGLADHGELSSLLDQKARELQDAPTFQEAEAAPRKERRF